jgi:flagellar protein FliS
MNNTNAAAAYRTAQFEGAPPLKILQLLYAGAIRYLNIARETDPGDTAYRENIHRAEEIVNELRASLDHAPNPELSQQLESLYLFMNHELSRALLEQDPSGIDATVKVLTTLLEGWKAASEELAKNPPGAGRAGDVA